MPDKYKAIWLSHSSYENYIKCSRLYYLANIYKDPKTKNKIGITSPYMSLGIAMHNVLEPLAEIKAEKRSVINLLEKYEYEFNKFHGDIGGWRDNTEEDLFYERGLEMIKKVYNNFQKENSNSTSEYNVENNNIKIKKGDNKYILLEKSIRPSLYYKGDMIPNIYISEKENIILCGSIDWIVYKEKVVCVIDFKTGRNEESEESSQLLIYKKLFESLQNKWKVNQYAYYYLESDKIKYKDWTEAEVNNRIEQMTKEMIRVGVEIRDSRYDLLWSKDKKYIEKYFPKDNFQANFKCKNGVSGCRNCLPYESIIRGQAVYVGQGNYGQDLYAQPQ